jgi:hypothetical protein
MNSSICEDFGGRPQPWKFAWVINFQKTGTFPLLGFLIEGTVRYPSDESKGNSSPPR